MSWLIAWLCVGFVVGVCAIPYIATTVFASISWVLCAVVILVVGFWKSRRWCIAGVVIAGALLGLFRGSLLRGELRSYDQVLNQTVVVSGDVVEDTDTTKDGSMNVRLRTVRIGEQEQAGTVWVSLRTSADIRRSDTVTVSGRMQEGFGTFAASIYQADLVRVERPVPGDIALQVRDWFAKNVRSAIPDPQAALGIGYLVGQRRALPPELDEALVVAGLTHIVVASGYNLTILVRLARRLFEKTSKYLAALSAGSMIAGFIAITGMSPSMSRAGLVAGLALLAWYVGRRFHPLVLLPLCAAITLVFNPSFGWGDLGWLLSFAAFGGVLVLAPLLQAYFYGDAKPGLLRQILGETIAATICTLPILMVAFGQISNVAVIANMLILPLVPLAMLLTFIAGIGAAVIPGMAELFGYPATVLLGYMIEVVQYSAGLPWASQEVTVPAWVAAVLYGGICLGAVYLWHRTRLDLQRTSVVE